MSTEKVAAPADQAQRDLILKELDCNMLVEAAAGTGKTTSMVGRMVELIAEGKSEPEKMAAITFTRKAAAELRGRFQVALEQEFKKAKGKRKEYLGRALAQIEQCFTGTIHSFCARLLRERPVEAGVDVAFEEIDDAEDDELRQEAWEDFCIRLIAHDPGRLLQKLESVGLELQDLQGAFKSYADYPDVDEWPLPPAGAPAPDFKKAARDLQTYLKDMSALIPKLPEDPGNDTLIPACRALTRIVAHYDDLTDPAQLLEFLERFKKVALVQKEWVKTGNFSKDDAKEQFARWERFRNEVVAPTLGKLRALRYGAVLEVLQEARTIYDQIRAERGLLNYQDLLMRAAKLLREAPHVRRYFRNRLTHLLVDEFQDTDPVQAEVIVLLTANDDAEKNWRACRPRPGSLFVVGDPKQSIYRFRRADIVTYNIIKDLIQRSGRVVTLSANFRTTQPIIEWVNKVFPAPGGFPQKATETSPAYVPLQAAKALEEPGNLAGLRKLTVPAEHSNNKADAMDYESDLIARFIRKALSEPLTMSGYEKDVRTAAQPVDFMILTRNSTNLSTYARALQQYGIPHQVTGGTALNELRELQLLHQALATVSRPDDPVRLVGVLRSELFGISDQALYTFKKAGGRFNFNSPVPQDLAAEVSASFTDAFAKLQSCQKWFKQLPPAVAVERAINELGLMASAALAPGGDVQGGALAKAVEILRGVQVQAWSAAEVLDYLGELVSAKDDTRKHDALSAMPEDRQVVRVMNLHKAKGLEAPIVFLADPSGDSDHPVQIHIDRSGDRIQGYLAVYGARAGIWGPLPLLAHAHDWDALELRERDFAAAEDLRLKYVAATRAGAMLVIAQKAKRNDLNPWRFFEGHLDEAEELENPGPQVAPATEKVALSSALVARAQTITAANLVAAFTSSYDIDRAKDYALSGSATRPTVPVWLSPETTEQPTREDRPKGEEWGTAIHLLLHLAASDRKASLNQAAPKILSAQKLAPALADTAMAEVNAVMQSPIWIRAMASRRCLAEVPFEMLHGHSGAGDKKVPLLLRGAIDLVFEEVNGWVIVDYKTDSVGGGGLRALTEKYAAQVHLYADAWFKCTGMKVKELGLFFTKAQRYVLIV